VVVEHATLPWCLEDLDLAHHVPVDHKSIIRQSVRVPRCECTDCNTKIGSQEIYAKEMFSEYYDILPGEGQELSENQYLLMASHMYAFMLKDRAHGMCSNFIHE